MTLAGLMVHLVDVERVTRTHDNKGGWTETWALVEPPGELTEEDVPCRIQPLSGAEIAKYGRVVEGVTHRIYFIPPIDIVAADRLRYGVRYFNVLNVRDIDELGRLVTVDASEEF